MPNFFQAAIIFFIYLMPQPQKKRAKTISGFDSALLDDADNVRERPFFAMIYLMTHIYRAALLGIQQMSHELHNGHHIGSDRHCDADAVNLT